MDKAKVLDDSVGNVMLQFSFSNPALIPRWVYHRGVEKYGQHKERKTLNGGVQFIQQTPNVSVAEFLIDLELEGYTLTDASYQERVDPNDHTRRKKYHAVRYVFTHHKKAVVGAMNDDFKNAKEKIFAELQKICEENTWRVRAYMNPADNPADGDSKKNISINCKVRTPLFYSDGRPITQWQKDERGNKIGDAPIPLKPAQRLCIKEKNIQLI